MVSVQTLIKQWDLDDLAAGDRMDGAPMSSEEAVIRYYQKDPALIDARIATNASTAA